MAYHYDPDLEFLGNLHDDELKQLYDVLVSGGQDGLNRGSSEAGSISASEFASGLCLANTGVLSGIVGGAVSVVRGAKSAVNYVGRISETLSSSDECKKYGTAYSRYWKRIAEEFQRQGGNSIANIYRGNGVKYNEILCDVCDKLKVNYNKNARTSIIEQNLLMKLATDSFDNFDKIDLHDRIALARSLGIDNVPTITPELLTGAFLALFKAGGFKSYKATVIITNAVWRALFGKGLTFFGNQLLTKTASILTGPVGWTITGAWTAFDIAGPAYRITIPAVLMIIYLRECEQASKLSIEPLK